MDRSIAVLVLLLVCASGFQNVYCAGLVDNFYAKSCPNAEKIIHDTVYRSYEKKGNIATSLIRFEFHDCFNGCDGSFLLALKKGQTSEKDSHTQVGMRNEKYVNDIKAAVEKECPGVVSCADILALGGAAGVSVLGGPEIKLKTGRRDGTVSLKSSADTIPHPQDSVSTVLAFFQGIDIKLDAEKVVALLGAHTIGRAHCESFQERIYPTVDPKMDPTFAKMLKYRCPIKADPKVHFTYFRNDEQSPMLFDNHYYVNLVAKQGLMAIDSNLYWDARTKPYVEKFAKDINYWRAQFAIAFKILSEVKPLTGTQGQIRKSCSFVN